MADNFDLLNSARRNDVGAFLAFFRARLRARKESGYIIGLAAHIFTG